jgi:hypothetical protein
VGATATLLQAECNPISKLPQNVWPIPGMTRSVVSAETLVAILAPGEGRYNANPDYWLSREIDRP